MSQENLATMGFDDAKMNVDLTKTESESAPVEVVAGLTAASKKKSTIFGLGPTTPRRGGGH